MLHNPISRGIPDFIKYNQALLGMVYGIEVYRNISRFFTHWVDHIFLSSCKPTVVENPA